MKIITSNYLKQILLSVLLISFSFYLQAESNSQQNWYLLNKIINNNSSSNNFLHSLLGTLAGIDCDKDDAKAQEELLAPLKMIANLQGVEVNLNWKLVEDNVIQAFPKFSYQTTTLAQNQFMFEVINDVIPIYQGMIVSMAKFCGVKHIRVARGLNFLAELYRTKNDYKQAEYALLDAMQIMMQTQYVNHPDTGAVYNHLGLLYNLTGEYSKAKEYYEKAVVLAKKVLGFNHPDTVRGLSNLAGIYVVLGDYIKAEKFYEEASEGILLLKSLNESEFDKWQRKIRKEFEAYEEVAVRQNVAQFYAVILGDYDKAESLLQESLRIFNGRQFHFFKGAIHHGLAYVYQQKLNYTQAIEHYKQALNIYRKLPAWKHSHFFVATLSQLGYVYYLQGDNIQKAERLLQQAVTLSQKIVGSEFARQLLLGQSLYNLGIFYQWTKQFDRAEEILQQAHQLLENSLGQKHPSVIEILQYLAALKFDQGAIEEAAHLVKKIQPLSENTLRDILSFGTEQQRLAYQKRSYPYDLLARLANQTGQVVSLANAVLHNKGIVLDSLMEDFHTQANPEIKAKIMDLKRQWINLTLSFPKDKNRIAQRKRLLKQDNIERQLKKLVSNSSQKVAQTRQAFAIQYQDVQKMLPNDSVLIEFIRYNHFIGRREGQAYYGAIIIPQQGEPKWVFLGEAKAIEQQIISYQNMMRCGNSCQQYDEETVIHILQTLYQRLWMPIEKRFSKRIKTVIISPDGEVNFVSFATLLTAQFEVEFLVQKFDLYYVSSGRDLLRKTKSLDEKSMKIYALNNWDTHTAKHKDQVATSTRNLAIEQAYLNLRLNHLKGIKQEVKALEKMGQTQQLTVETFFNSKATEKQLYNWSRSPYILHFATHGVFLQPKKENLVTEFLPTSSLGVQEIPLKFLNHPMRRSFITLAGAQITLDAWKEAKNSPFPPENDGILMAGEVSLIDLENTWLTVFSACETGRGEGRVGEGVLGLRRGFVQAGTQNLLMTLWSFQDNLSQVRQFEVEFYQQAIKTQNAPKALNDVQRKWFLQLWDNEEPIISTEILLDIVRVFGPFVMSFQGKL